MCFMSQPQYAAPPPVAPAPTRAQIQADAAAAQADVDKDPTNLAVQARRVATKRQSVFGNVKTSTMGDSTYGGSTFASFGKLPTSKAA